MLAVEIKDLSKEIKGRKILTNVNLEIKPATVNAFFGPNGSGKTMLFRAISGLIRPDSGKIKIFGKLLGDNIKFPPSLGLMIENVGFWKEYTGFENLKLLAGIKNEIGDSEIKESLMRVGLNPDDKRTYNKYSLGMKQRLGIAQAIMEKPDLLILDEPTNTLDDDALNDFKNILKEEVNRGATVLMASHRKEDFENLADRYFQMKEEGVLQEVKID